MTSRPIMLNLDLNAALLGFGSARAATPAHHRIARHYASPLLFGPPPSDALLEWVMHLYTDEEAEMVQHLPPLRARRADQVARRTGRPADEAARVLDHLALDKCVLLARGRPRRYAILPVAPGTFELALMTNNLATRNAWHQRFAVLFENLWDSGYVKEYLVRGRPVVRYLPVGGVARTLNAAWPAERLEELLAPHRHFAVAHCQCRLAMRLTGRGCDRPLENCAFWGAGATLMIRRGQARRVEREELIAIKRQAEAAGCVNFIINAVGAPNQGNGSCSCCGCCCHVLRAITEFAAPALVCQPHFRPQRNAEQCARCGRCARACPVGAWSLQARDMTLDVRRCIGCGLCVTACKPGALTLQPVAGARPPDGSWAAFALKQLPAYLYRAARVWAGRKFKP